MREERNDPSANVLLELHVQEARVRQGLQDSPKIRHTERSEFRNGEVADGAINALHPKQIGIVDDDRRPVPRRSHVEFDSVDATAIGRGEKRLQAVLSCAAPIPAMREDQRPGPGPIRFS